MKARHYFNYRQKFGSRAADRRQDEDDRLQRQRDERERDRHRVGGMGSNGWDD